MTDQKTGFSGIKLPRGVRITVSRPHQYSMNYLNGKFSYRESFVQMHVGNDYASKITFAYDSVFTAIAGSLATVPGIGAGLAFAVKFGSEWFKKASMNSDGSIDFYAAYHYVGMKSGGVDITATPWPGVDARLWQGAVNNMIRGARALNRFTHMPTQMASPNTGSLQEIAEKELEGDDKEIIELDTEIIIGDLNMPAPQLTGITGTMEKSEPASSQKEEA